jgi:ABC-type glycerol-3-phosphate transport system substrate-binding protein
MKTKFGSLVMGFAVAILLTACAGTSAPHPLVGGWAITIDTPVGSMAGNLNINPDMTGEMSSTELGSAALTGITVDGETVQFSTTIDAQGQTITLAFNGTVTGDQLAGQFNTDFGPIAVSGVRQ